MFKFILPTHKQRNHALTFTVALFALATLLGTASASASEWECSQCTLLNNKEANHCEVCETPKSVVPVSFTPETNGGESNAVAIRLDANERAGGAQHKPNDVAPAEWSCSQCTFDNAKANETCEMCGTIATAISAETAQGIAGGGGGASDASGPTLIGGVSAPTRPTLFAPTNIFPTEENTQLNDIEQQLQWDKEELRKAKAQLDEEKRRVVVETERAKVAAELKEVKKQLAEKKAEADSKKPWSPRRYREYIDDIGSPF